MSDNNHSQLQDKALKIFGVFEEELEFGLLVNLTKDKIDALEQLVNEAISDARIEENKYWCMVLDPAMDGNSAMHEDFYQRIAELKGQRAAALRGTGETK